jgi:hypothetical protein
MSRAQDRPLFVPLKREWFEAFREGTKTVEYRLHGPRWNERTCVTGRAVVLSLGYSGARLTARIQQFRVIANPGIDFFPAEAMLAAIHLEDIQPK